LYLSSPHILKNVPAVIVALGVKGEHFGGSNGVFIFRIRTFDHDFFIFRNYGNYAFSVKYFGGSEIVEKVFVSLYGNIATGFLFYIFGGIFQDVFKIDKNIVISFYFVMYFVE